MKLPDFLLRSAATMLSPAGSRAQLLVLLYHRILASPDPLLPGEVDVNRFRMQLAALRDCFQVYTLDEAMQRMRRGKLGARAVCITFDDGYASNAELGLPILQEFGLQATFFVATGFLNGGRMFNDTVIEAVRGLDTESDLTSLGFGRLRLDTDAKRVALIAEVLKKIKYLPSEDRIRLSDRLTALSKNALPDDLMMCDADVARLQDAGMEIGGHTVTHPILSRLSDDAAHAEIVAGRDRLQDITGDRLQSFAYPNGRPGTDYTAAHARIVAAAGFRQAVSTAWGAAKVRSDVYQIPRISSWDVTPQRFILRLIRAYTQPAAATV